MEQYIEHANRDAEILLAARPKDFGAINRAPLWTPMCKKDYL